ncbi:uncharacterized protein AMSG_05865 [Thecamonas trahens ATCC 50062]|uniref:Amino acid permease n=1 Tax=Thecamonas trahens ATCC 50062 TaxID=461836 RepID=A0A0L0DD21_THETB|nr:hypothetical protein AMSG_05865 [Thecamonas trahens ATCC 50062]KNC50095.1 hypothetical protein AMSG_05865 [Thecamonas trahens ATCC 50062]|eukprot:XP_013757257.1 hypothetical protein AMSG_05865 [Thecamonas trahens ATCC 50062]
MALLSEVIGFSSENSTSSLGRERHALRHERRGDDAGRGLGSASYELYTYSCSSNDEMEARALPPAPRPSADAPSANRSLASGSGLGSGSGSGSGSHFEVIDTVGSSREAPMASNRTLDELEGGATLTLSSRTRTYLAKAIKATDEIPVAPDPHGDAAPAGKLLNQFLASGICCNNIGSSCLYVIALCAAPAGKYAPIALLIICGLLYLFRSIYTEVVSALPVNGGTYNLLLNTTSKAQASLAACLTMLSYVATAVISSSSAIRYIKSLATDVEWFNVITFTIALLAFVAILNLLGITESAGVALGILLLHCSSLAILLVCSAIKAVTDMPRVGNESVLSHNWTSTSPDGGVCLVPMALIEEQATEGALLSLMGRIAAGKWLEVLIIIDAGLVLTGAVISSFVGFNGLVHRMTMDRCLPQILLRTNKLRGTRHYIIVGLWLLTSAMVLFTGGKIDIMAGVYTIAFLAVMTLFTVGNMLLKLRRSNLPTRLRASWPTVIVAFLGVVLGLIGNIVSRDQTALAGFFIFGAVFALPVLVMLNRTQLLRMVATATASFARSWLATTIARRIHFPAKRLAHHLTHKPLVYFTNHDDPVVQAKVVRYVLNNELRRWIKFVRVYPHRTTVPGAIPASYLYLQRQHPDMRIDYVAVVGDFSPAMVRHISFVLHVPTMFMFMSSFGDSFPHSYMSLGGLRLLM